MSEERDDMRIYVASLADYNAGRLHGVWIDVEGKTGDEIYEEVKAMLLSSPTPLAEEYAIHDYEGFMGIRLSEYEGLDTIATIAEGISEYGEAYAAYASDVGHPANLQDFEDSFYEAVDDLAEFAYEMFDAQYGIDALDEKFPLAGYVGSLSCYVDWEQMGKDLATGFSSVERNGTIYLFT